MAKRIDDNHWIVNKASAHRGFHGNGVPENGKTAFLNAIELGYPIETDVQLSSDLVPVCFHDDNLKRVTGVDSLIWDKSLEEIKRLRLFDTDEQILTLEEFLNFVDGRVPLLIEIKTQRNNKVVVEKVIDLLKNYKGEYVIQSFDPRIMGYVRKINPQIIRGQLMCKERHENLSFIADKLLSNGYLNFLSKPDFINMNQKFLPVCKRITKGKRLLCWTVRSEEEESVALKHVDSYVFENIVPKVK
jgi:glycerophosphoryl diester phosphodiesterase